LFCAVRNWHGGPNKKNLVLEQFGVEVPFTYIYDEDHALYDEPLWFTTDNIADHPLAKGVSSVYVMGARPVTGAGEPIVSTSETSYTYHPWYAERQDGPVAIVRAVEFGKGRVVAIGTDYLFRPDDLEQADNKKLFENITDWLAEPTAGASKSAAKVDLSKLKQLPEVPPAQPAENVAKLWTFEQDPQFPYGTFVAGFAYTGKGCMKNQHAESD